MFRLHIIQAEFGDCLILEFGTNSLSRYILVDGGPNYVYNNHLRNELQAIDAKGGKLELVVLSHVDNDHIIGLLDLMAELFEQRTNNTKEIISIEALWHNTFDQTIGHGNDIEARLKTAIASSDSASQSLTSAGMAIQGIGEGRSFYRRAKQLNIPINPGFANDLICVDYALEPIEMSDLKLYVVGPTQKNLDELEHEWQDWLDKHADDIASGDPMLAEKADQSIPNLSSIMLLARIDGKSILLTGDGRSDHLLQGLEQAGLTDDKGCLHVDVYKFPHHGSDRNVTREFFYKVTADQYVVSANGKYGNPDLATLIWAIEAAKDQNRSIEILATNGTSSINNLMKNYKPEEYGYHLTIMPSGAHSMPVELSA